VCQPADCGVECPAERWLCLDLGPHRSSGWRYQKGDHGRTYFANVDGCQLCHRTAA
jgi:hypothetical protein